MSKTDMTVAMEKRLRCQEEESLRGTRLFSQLYEMVQSVTESIIIFDCKCLQSLPTEKCLSLYSHKEGLQCD